MAKNTKKQTIFQSLNIQPSNTQAPKSSKDWADALGIAYADLRDGKIDITEAKQITALANAVVQLKLNEIRVFRELKELGNPDILVKQLEMHNE